METAVKTTSKLDQVADFYVEGLGNILSEWGISKVSSQIFVYLQTQSSPVSLNQVVEDLQISKGNVSINIL